VATVLITLGVSGSFKQKSSASDLTILLSQTESQAVIDYLNDDELILADLEDIKYNETYSLHAEDVDNLNDQELLNSFENFSNEDLW
jgi:hypothetical protein